jgi:hypothetical protein
MRPPSPAVFRRFLLLGALIMALTLAGCGGGDSGTPGKDDTGSATGTTTTSDPATAKDDRANGGGKRVVASGSCKSQLGEFVHALDRLRVRLATGLSYEEYDIAVKKTHSAYAALPAGELPADCLIAAGTAAEKSVNLYIEAANAWGECLADAGCDAGVVEPELQRDWQVASHWLSEAHEGLKRVS